MKDVTKLISNRATRFIPVDMKDRLKTVFNRAGKPQAALDEEIPDYTAIFNANKSPNQKKARFDGPLEPPQLSAPPQNQRIADRSREHDIEEAEVVSEPAAEQNPAPQWQHAASAESRAQAKGAKETKWQPAPEEPTVTTVVEAAATASFDERPARARRTRPEEHQAEAFRSESKPVVEEHRPNARFDTSFEDRMAESARLKVEPRHSEPRHVEPRAAEEPQPVMASSGYYRAPEPLRPERRSAESKARDSEEHLAAAFSYENQPLEQPRDTYRTAGQSAPRTAESPERNLHQEKETSMQAKGQESIHENGQTAVRTDGANIASIAIERNSKFSGQLKFSGAVAIDGQVEGEIVAERVVVHEGGVVNATVEGNTIVIAGTVKGDVYARGELEILASGVVHGSVTTPQVSVRRGGRIDGRCAIGAPRQ